MVGDVCDLSFVGCCLGYFKNSMLGLVSVFLSLSHFFCPSFWRVSMAFKMH